MEIRIAEMQVEHISAVIDLEKQNGLSSRVAGSYEQLLQNTEAVLLVALSESKVIGCFSGWMVADEFEIDNVAVAVDARRLGVASNLLGVSIEMARQKGAVRAFLEVRSANQAACLLYQKLGFAVVGKRKNYYRAPADDALILSLEIVS